MASVTDGPAGAFTVSLTSAQTATLRPAVYRFDVWRTDTRGVFGRQRGLEILAEPRQLSESTFPVTAHVDNEFEKSIWTSRPTIAARCAYEWSQFGTRC